MHNYSMLHSNDFGFIGQCNSCGDFQLGMGNVVIVLSREELYQLGKSINVIQKKLEDNTIKELTYPLLDGRTILLKSPADEMMLSFYQAELMSLNDLLNMSSVLLEAKEILLDVN